MVDFAAKKSQTNPPSQQLGENAPDQVHATVRALEDGILAMQLLQQRNAVGLEGPLSNAQAALEHILGQAMSPADVTRAVGDYNDSMESLPTRRGLEPALRGTFPRTTKVNAL